MDTQTQTLEDAKQAYADARQSLRDSIEANRKAMAAFRIKGSPENKAAYDKTRAAHKAQLANIKAVRSAFYTLLSKS